MNVIKGFWIMNKSLLLLVSFAGLVACFGDKDKKEELAQDGQTATDTCPAAEPEKKADGPAAVSVSEASTATDASASVSAESKA